MQRCIVRVRDIKKKRKSDYGVTIIADVAWAGIHPSIKFEFEAVSTLRQLSHADLPETVMDQLAEILSERLVGENGKISLEARKLLKENYEIVIKY
ncbi:MAG: hypothetical protein JEZ08_25500 [Clostridiales bacterium]|nr:hypothetical protein [Clostridiales bacterium]